MERNPFRTLFLLGTLFAATGVAAGAFGAHGLKASLSPRLLEVFETAVRYQMYHAMGLIAAAITVRVVKPQTTKRIRSAAWFLTIGIVLFSGSLYAMVLSGITWFGFVTPIGGVLFIAGWLLLALAVLKSEPGT